MKIKKYIVYLIMFHFITLKWKLKYQVIRFRNVPFQQIYPKGLSDFRYDQSLEINKILL